MNTRHCLLFCTVFSAVLFGVIPSAQSTERPTERLRILSYDSMRGKKSLGEFLDKAFVAYAKTKGIEVTLEWLGTSGNASLEARARADSSRTNKLSYDVILGLDEKQFLSGKQDGLWADGRAFDQSPLVFLADTQKLPPEKWPHSWADVSARIEKQVILEDPRLSAPGFGWLRAIFEAKLLNLSSAKKIEKRIFPSWSSAYESFLHGEAPVIWTYLTSEAYHRCHDKLEGSASPRYRAMPLLEGYPNQIEWAVDLKSSKAGALFLQFLLTPEAQAQMASLNWMLPIIKETKLPDCYRNLTAVKTLDSKLNTFSNKDVRTWMDQWSL